jgi:DNA-binding NarL/FixJ family response regulator
MDMDSVAVGVYASDPVTEQGTIARLSSYPGIEVLGPDECWRCEVLLVIVSDVTEHALSAMRRVHQKTEARALNIVLVANTIHEQQVLRAVQLGLVSLLFRQDTSFDRIAAAVRAARDGRAQLPATVTRYLLDQMRALTQNVAALHGTGMDGLASREIQVLKLFADGFDTGEVAQKLNYSERTVKNILHGVVTRLNLRNRTHAVAFALRAGAL